MPDSTEGAEPLEGQVSGIGRSQSRPMINDARWPRRKRVDVDGCQGNAGKGEEGRRDGRRERDCDETRTVRGLRGGAVRHPSFTPPFLYFCNTHAVRSGKFFSCISLFVYSLDCLPILDDPPLPSKRFFARALFHVGDLCDEKQLPMFQAASATEQRKEEVMRKRKKEKKASAHALTSYRSTV